MEIKSTTAPASARSKRYPSGSTVVYSGGGGSAVTGSGSSVDVLKSTSGMSLSDANVLSSLRTLIEIRKHFVAKDDADRELTDTNAFSSLRTVDEIDKAISELKAFLESNYLSKVKDDRAAGTIAFEKDITVGQRATTLNLIVEALAHVYDLQVDHVATLFRTIVKDYVSSETFIPGMMGEGAKLYKTLSGDWNLELDSITVRKAITTFEMIISKVRAVNGGLVVSVANGSVKSVSETTGDPAYYVLGIEGDMVFIADDLVRCQVFTSGHTKYYWCPIEQVNDDSILILKSSFPDGVTPAEGDELVQMGNRTDTSRQGALYLTASEDGKPRFSVLDGINSPSLSGKNKVILGCLDGITDTDFPADYQPEGYGLYAMNVFLKGLFILRNGKSVDSALSELASQIEAIPGQISLKVSEEVGKVQIGGRNYFKKTTPLNALYGTPTLEHDLSINGLRLVGDSSGNSALRMQRVIDSNGYWTISFDIKGTQGTGDMAFRIDICDNYEITTNREADVYLTEDNEYHHHEYTYNVQNYSSDIYNFVDFENLGFLYIYVRNLKIEKGNKATDWTPAPEDLEGIAKTYTDAQIKIVNDNISSKVNQTDFDTLGNVVSKQGTTIEQSLREIDLVAKASGNAQTIALAMSQGKMLYRDPTFKEGNNGISVYNNNGNGTVGIYRESISGNPNDSGIGLKIVSQGNASPGSGGFYFGTQSRANSVFVTRFIANIPVGYKVEWASNAIGDGGYDEWLTSQEGTGNWQEYACIVYCGSTETFSSTNFFYITNGGAVTWYLAYASVFDATGVNDFQTKDEIKAGITITPNNVNVFGKDISLQGKVTIGSLDGTVIEGGKIKTSLINAHQIVVDGLNAGRITTGNLSVTNGAKIGDWTIEGGSIVARNTASAKILVEPSGTRFLRINDSSNLMDVRADGVTGINIYTSDLFGKCLALTAQTNGTAIESRGNHNFYARPEESINFHGQVNMSGLCLKNENMYSGQIGSDTVFVRCLEASYDPTFILPKSPAYGRTVFICSRNRAIIVKSNSGYIRANNRLLSVVSIGGADRISMFVFGGDGYWTYSYLNN